MTVTVRRLGSSDAALGRQLNELFANVFEDADAYLSSPPGGTYFARVLGRDDVIALAALNDHEVVGGLVGYVLHKLEQERSEIYIYDLAVAEPHRRRGIASALINELQSIASAVGAWVIYVQADHGDEAAIALYEKLGRREDVMHFDIAPRTTR